MECLISNNYGIPTILGSSLDALVALVALDALLS